MIKNRHSSNRLAVAVKEATAAHPRLGMTNQAAAPPIRSLAGTNSNVTAQIPQNSSPIHIYLGTPKIFASGRK